MVAGGNTFVYVSNADSKDILVFSLDMATGALDPVQQVELTTPGALNPLAVSPDRHYRMRHSERRRTLSPASASTNSAAS